LSFSSVAAGRENAFRGGALSLKPILVFAYEDLSVFDLQINRAALGA
jgi:hypothetical protein